MRWKDKGSQLSKLMKNLPNPVEKIEEENQFDQLMKNLSTLMGDKRRKRTDFQEKGSSLFRPFISIIHGWPASFLFACSGRLNGGPSHGQSGVNWGEGYCCLSRVLLIELAKQLLKMLYHRSWFPYISFFWIAFPVDKVV